MQALQSVASTLAAPDSTEANTRIADLATQQQDLAPAIDMRTLQSVASALAALDFTEENTRIADLAAQQQDLTTAIARADARRLEINGLLAGENRRSGLEVADALMNGEVAALVAATPSREALYAEREGLAEGIRELRFRGQDLRADTDAVRMSAEDRARVAVEPLAAELLAEVAATFARLITLHASLTAIAGATGNARQKASNLREMLAMAKRNALLHAETPAEVPADICRALQPLASKGHALRDVQLLTVVHY